MPVEPMREWQVPVHGVADDLMGKPDGVAVADRQQAVGGGLVDQSGSGGG